MTIPQTIQGIDIMSAAAGAGLVIFAVIIHAIIKKVIKKLKKNKMNTFDKIQQRVTEGHKGLVEANKVYQEIFDLFEGIQNAKR